MAEIVSELMKIVNSAKERKVKLLEKVGIADAKKREHNEKMEAFHKEMSALIVDPRYAHQQEYLTEEVNSLLVDLLNVLVVDVKNISKNDTLPKAQAIAGRLYQDLKLMGRASRFFKDYADYEKMTKKKEQKDDN
jgi:hypothetical protein